MKEFEQARKEMVELLRRNYRIRDERVLEVMAQLPRHRFIPGPHQDPDAYGDYPCSIGCGQTISQPYIVAYMTQALGIQPGEKVLEIGTGSGYQAAVLARLGAQVFSMECIPELVTHAKSVFMELGIANVQVRLGDGANGWPEEAPFDVIIGTCAANEVPPALTEQLTDGGRMILPVGNWDQRLVIAHKQNETLFCANDLPVRFVPMV